MDTSYYKCLLRKMNLFRPKNKLGKPAEENEAKKVKNVNLNGQKAQEYEEM